MYLYLFVFLLAFASGQSNPLPTNVTDNQKVFILTQPRSGSTFVGELFRQNPDFAYLFEPLRAFSEQFTWDECRDTPHNSNLEGIMRAVYNCDFSVLQKSLPDWGPLYGWDRIAQFSGQQAICLPPNSSSPRARKMSIAVKEIEMWAPKLTWLQTILESDLYVIWLVRDVRGWVSSWIVPSDDGMTFYDIWAMDKMNLWGYYSGCSILENHSIMCPKLFARIKDILTNSSAAPHLKMAAWWTLDIAVSRYYTANLNGKLKLITYEQVSLQPQKVANEIYSFLGRDGVPTEVSEYLTKCTKGGDIGERYATNRNSTAMVDIWQSRLTPVQIREIEEIAGVWFPYFGYERLTGMS